MCVQKIVWLYYAFISVEIAILQFTCTPVFSVHQCFFHVPGTPGWEIKELFTQHHLYLPKTETFYAFGRLFKCQQLKMPEQEVSKCKILKMIPSSLCKKNYTNVNLWKHTLNKPLGTKCTGLWKKALIGGFKFLKSGNCSHESLLPIQDNANGK